jgi:hypothetical protein
MNRLEVKIKKKYFVTNQVLVTPPRSTYVYTNLKAKMEGTWMSAAEQRYHSRNTKVATYTFNWR